MTNYLFDHLGTINTQLRSATNILLCLDYDGTLVNFENAPEKVTTPLSVQKILQILAISPQITVALITGRTAEDIKKRINYDHLIIGSTHGLLIEYPNKPPFIWEKAQKLQPLIQQIKYQIVQTFTNIPGVLIEDKKVTIAVHYRQAANNQTSKIIHKFESIVTKNDINHELELLKGSKVMEARPTGWNKGKAIQHLLTTHCRKNDMLPLYIGDDTTDEDAFYYLRNKGITILVNHHMNKKTDAQYFVHQPQEVHSFLNNIILHRAIQKKSSKNLS